MTDAAKVEEPQEEPCDKCGRPFDDHERTSGGTLLPCHHPKIKRPPRCQSYDPWGFFASPDGVGTVLGLEGDVPVPGKWIIAHNKLFAVVGITEKPQKDGGKFKAHVVGWSD